MKQTHMKETKKTGNKFFEIGLFFLIIIMLSGNGIWQAYLQNWEISIGGTLFSQGYLKDGGRYFITYLNQESLYISVLSAVYSFLGNKEEVVSCINLILQILGVVFYYLGAKKLYHKVFHITIMGICGILSSCFYPVVWDTSMHLVWLMSGVVFWIGSQTYNAVAFGLLKKIIFGFLLGIYCYIDFAGFFLLLAFSVFILSRREDAERKTGVFSKFLYFLLAVIIGFFVMFCLWNNFLLNTTVLQNWFHDRSYFISSQVAQNQYISLALLVGICVVFYIVKSVRGTSSERQLTVLEEDMNLPVEAVLTKELDVKTENEIISKDVNETEMVKPIKLIENPLPLPKKHVKKEMNYAFEPSEEQMHYDLNNYSIDDDYDLKDI